MIEPITNSNNVNNEEIQNDIKEKNKKINLMYRQLGKNLYNSKTDKTFVEDKSKTEQLIKLITKTIEEIEALKIKNIKKPEKNEDGFLLLTFCPHCKVGNHPESSHCIHCGKQL